MISESNLSTLARVLALFHTFAHGFNAVSRCLKALGKARTLSDGSQIAEWKSEPMNCSEIEWHVNEQVTLPRNQIGRQTTHPPAPDSFRSDYLKLIGMFRRFSHCITYFDLIFFWSHVVYKDLFDFFNDLIPFLFHFFLMLVYLYSAHSGC